MTEITKTATVPYSPTEMFRLVNDIESYAQFLPWCTDTKILHKAETQVTATVSLAMGKLRQSFTTENTMESDRLINMRLVTGPFKKLEGSWGFQPHNDNGCLIKLHMDFEFENKLLKYTLGGAFNKIVNSLVAAFAERAQQVYGKR